jgi:hypothetical protein
MINTVITTDQEKFEMYSLLSKEQLIKMLIEANKHLYRLTPTVLCPKCGISSCSGSTSGSVKCYCSNEIQ